MDRLTSVQRRVPLNASEDELADLDVQDALRSTPEERMAAAVALLDAAYQLWQDQGLADAEGLCRSPGRTRQERRPIRNEKPHGGAGDDS